MKTFIFIISLAIAMAFNMNSFANTPERKPGDGNNNSKLRTTVRCGSEKRPKIRNAARINPCTKVNNPGKFNKKKYGNRRKHR